MPLVSVVFRRPACHHDPGALGDSRSERGLWLDIAASELARLQSEFRTLQGQAHAVVGVGIAFAGLSVAFGGEASLGLAAMAATLGIGIAMAWYLNINAESVAVGLARDALAVKLNREIARANLGRAVYGDAVQRAGRMAASTVGLLALLGVLGIAVSGAAVWISFQSPDRFDDRYFIPDGWRQAAQLTVSALTAAAVLSSIWDNLVGYQRRFLLGIRAEGATRG